MQRDQPIKQELSRLARIATPIMITNVSMMFMGVVDTFMVGKISSTELAAVGAASNVYWFIVVFGSGLLNSLDTLISQAFGAKQFKAAYQYLYQGILAGLASCIIMIPACYLVAYFYYLVGADEQVLQSVRDYLYVIAWGTPFIMIFSCYQKFWQAQGITLPITLIMILCNVINYFADDAVVLGKYGFPQMGAVGVAWASWATRFACVGMVLCYTHWKFKHDRSPFVAIIEKLKTEGTKRFKYHPLQQRKIWQLGVPSAIQIFFEAGAFMLASVVAASLSVISLAAHNVVLMIAATAFMMPLGISAATSVRVGYHIGKGNQMLAKHAGWLGIAMGAAVMTVSAFIVLTFSKPLVSVFTRDVLVVETALKMMVLVGIFQVFDGIQVTISGAMRGAGNTRSPMYAYIFGYYVVGLSLALHLCYTKNLGIYGIWVGLATALIIASIILLWMWQRTISRPIKVS